MSYTIQTTRLDMQTKPTLQQVQAIHKHAYKQTHLL